MEEQISRDWRVPIGQTCIFIFIFLFMSMFIKLFLRAPILSSHPRYRKDSPCWCHLDDIFDAGFTCMMAPPLSYFPAFTGGSYVKILSPWSQAHECTSRTTSWVHQPLVKLKLNRRWCRRFKSWLHTFRALLSVFISSWFTLDVLKLCSRVVESRAQNATNNNAGNQ